jgi:hypothetical protein
VPPRFVTGSRLGDLLLLLLLTTLILSSADRLIVYEKVPRWAIERAREGAPASDRAGGRTHR